jgi:hypothetical protein
VNVYRLIIYLITPPKFNIHQRPLVYILIQSIKRPEVGDYRLLLSLYIYLSLSIVY